MARETTIICCDVGITSCSIVLVDLYAWPFVTCNLSLDVTGTPSMIDVAEILTVGITGSVCSRWLDNRCCLILDSPSSTVTVDIGITINFTIFHILFCEVVAFGY